MAETSSSITVSTKLERIAKLALAMPQAALTTLAHHIDIDWLREAYRRTRKDGATGIDRQTADQYARNLDENLARYLRALNPAATWRHRSDECISRRRGMVRKRGPSAYQPSRTRCFSGRWQWCWKQSTSRVFSTAHTAFGPAARRTRRCGWCETRRWRWRAGGFLRLISETFSGP